MLSVFQKIEGQIWQEARIYIDGGLWYHLALRWLRLEHRVYGTKMKNLMERFIQYIKDDRTECVSMTIFPAESAVVKDNMYMELAQIVVHIVFAYWHRQDTVFTMFLTRVD